MIRPILILIGLVWLGILLAMFVPMNMSSLGSKPIDVKNESIVKPAQFKPLNRFVAIKFRPVFSNNVTNVLPETNIVPESSADEEIDLGDLQVLGVSQIGSKWRAHIQSASLEYPIWVDVGEKLGGSIVSEISEIGIRLTGDDRDELYLIYEPLQSYTGENIFNSSIEDIED